MCLIFTTGKESTILSEIKKRKKALKNQVKKETSFHNDQPRAAAMAAVVRQREMMNSVKPTTQAPAESKVRKFSL